MEEVTGIKWVGSNGFSIVLFNYVAGLFRKALAPESLLTIAICDISCLRSKSLYWFVKSFNNPMTVDLPENHLFWPCRVSEIQIRQFYICSDVSAVE
ncbi:hypothetical protein EV1_021045 [Malus domestica]